MLNEGQKFMDDLRGILKKYNLSNTEIRILWEESDAFVSNFMAGKAKTLNFGKLISLVHNTIRKQLPELYLDIVVLIQDTLKPGENVLNEEDNTIEFNED